MDKLLGIIIVNFGSCNRRVGESIQKYKIRPTKDEHMRFADT